MKEKTRTCPTGESGMIRMMINGMNVTCPTFGINVTCHTFLFC
jgi:hypothetical protein